MPGPEPLLRLSDVRRSLCGRPEGPAHDRQAPGTRCSAYRNGSPVRTHLDAFDQQYHDTYVKRKAAHGEVLSEIRRHRSRTLQRIRR